MSLLMEALRKAEEAKRRMQQEEAARGDADASGNPSGASSAFTLEEREAGVTPQYIRDNFTPEQNAGPANAGEALGYDDLLDAVDAFAEGAGAPARAAPATQRAAAASVFAAKRKPARNRSTLAILVAIMLLMVPLGGGILWYLQAANTSSIGLNPALANYDLSTRSFDDAATGSEAPASAPNAAAATQADAEAAATPAAGYAGASAAATANPDAMPTAAGNADATPAAVVTRDSTPASAIGEETVAAQAPEPRTGTMNAPASMPAPAVAASATTPDLTLPASAPAPVLEVSRSRGTPQVDPDLVAAYSRLQDGDIAGAGTLYRQVLATLPNNRDALLGMALVHMREGRVANARELYARLLELNPRDPLAHTGLLQTMQAGSPAEHENTLKTLIAQFPNVAQLTLALGNHYAAQGRWSEAQAAYYNALLTARRGTGGPVHPDYAFNLAVSLEQLNQPQAALDYYRQAQALAADVTPGFDLQLLNDRLAYLLSEQAPR